MYYSIPVFVPRFNFQIFITLEASRGWVRYSTLGYLTHLDFHEGISTDGTSEAFSKNSGGTEIELRELRCNSQKLRGITVTK